MLSIHHRGLLATVLLLSLLLGGCFDDTPRGVVEDYRNRVANVLEIDIQPAPAIYSVSFPAKRDRIWPTEDLSAGLLDSIEFRQCDLLPLIVERNSSLGKVMPPSKLMSYELRFFQKLLPCYLKAKQGEFTDASDDFLELLNETFRVKSANLPAVVWNGIFASDEVAAQFSSSKQPIPLQGNPGFQGSFEALSYFGKLTQAIDQYRHDGSFEPPSELGQEEDYFFNLYASEYGGELQASLKLLIGNLRQVADVINRKLDQRPLCFNKQSNSEADILLNVFNRYYAAKIQPYMAMIQKQGAPWYQQTNHLLSFGGANRPPDMLVYQQEAFADGAKNSLWNQYQQAIKLHTKAWQRVLGQCGLMPGS